MTTSTNIPNTMNKLAKYDRKQVRYLFGGKTYPGLFNVSVTEKISINYYDKDLGIGTVNVTHLTEAEESSIEEDGSAFTFSR
jgi:hypothetical protein